MKTAAKAPKGAKRAEPLFGDTIPAGEAACLILCADYEKFRKKREAVLASEDAEAVHDMRVAIRRMRAAFKTFHAFLSRSILELDPELDWIFTKLGAVRDLDVQISKLHEWAKQHKDAGLDLTPLFARLEAELRRARILLLRALNSERFTYLAAKLKSEIGKGSTFDAELANSPILAVAPDLVRKVYRKTAKAARGLDEDSSSTNFHRTRRQAKKLRYCLEFFRDLYAEPADGLISKLKEVQDLLGARQDDIVARDHLSELAARNGLSPDAKELAKEIGCDYRAEAKAFEKQFGALSKKAFGKPWKELHKAMEERRRDSWS